MLNNNRQITISAAGTRKSTVWLPQKIFVSEFYEKLKVPTRGTETLSEYLSLPKNKQDELKDNGGFNGGSFKDNRRKAQNVLGRDLITLDLDNIPCGNTNAVLRRIEGLGCNAAVYSTRKHEEIRPRLRLIVPLDRTASAEEYEPIARKLAEVIGMELCDATTFEASRLMYWPSCCSDSNYVYKYWDKPFLSVDGMLALYKNWRNVSEWPQMQGAAQTPVKLAAKQGSPLEKTGIVGAFCRTYDVYKAMEVFLPGVYIPCDDSSGRFTYSGGSTTGGAVVYENGSFLYSHHSTDPASGKLCNAFDLVRLHKFQELDEESKADTPISKLPSYTAMCEYALKDSYVAALLNQERYDKAVQAFDAPLEEDNSDWMSKLQVSALTGTPAKTIDNIIIILDNDPLLKNRIAFNEFSNRAEILGALPWDAKVHRRTWGDKDDAGLVHYLEHTYSIKGDKSIDRAFTLCAFKHSFNGVQDYLKSLSWDGVNRVDTLLTDYLGARDTEYTRAVMRKSLAAAVARVMTPGCKYDYMPILVGPQGIGKSTFLRILGRQWFSDSLQTFEGKEASEMIQGVWINEIGELSGFNRSETNAVKQFLSRTEDIYREPFGKRTNPYPRRCVFFGTTNDSEFLKDRTGNRRFWPVDTGVIEASKSVFRELLEEVDQIWAEAFVRWQLGEQLYLSGEARSLAEEEQESHSESNAKEGIVREFLERPVPLNWEKKTLSERRLYWATEFYEGSLETAQRSKVCAVEIFCECYGNDIKHMKRKDSTDINNILERLEEWKRQKTPMRYGCYGPQRGFTRV